MTNRTSVGLTLDASSGAMVTCPAMTPVPCGCSHPCANPIHAATPASRIIPPAIPSVRTVFCVMPSSFFNIQRPDRKSPALYSEIRDVWKEHLRGKSGCCMIRPAFLKREMMPTNPGFQISIDVKGRPCLVLGGDDEAADKAQRLLDAGAKVTVINPTLNDQLRRLTATGKIIHRVRTFRAPDADGTMLVINTLSGDRDYAKSLYELA